MLNLRHVESLLAVLSAGSFRAAARQLGRPQPTLTQHIQKLESELAVRLLTRTAGGCSPTAEGLTFLPYARALMRTQARALVALSTGRLALGASGNIGVYLLQPVIARFASHGYPLPEVTIAPNPEIAEMLHRGEIDLAMMEWWDHRPGFTAVRWRSEELVVVVSPTHPWAERSCIEAAELAGQPIIGGEPGTGTGRILAKELGEVGRQLTITLTLGSTEAVKNAVQAELGISILLAGSVAREVEAGRLCAVNLRGVELRKDLFAIHPDDLPRGSPAHPFAQLLA